MQIWLRQSLRKSKFCRFEFAKVCEKVNFAVLSLKKFAEKVILRQFTLSFFLFLNPKVFKPKDLRGVFRFFAFQRKEFKNERKNKQNGDFRYDGGFGNNSFPFKAF